MRNIMTLGLVGLLGCSGSGDDSGRLVGSGAGSSKIDSAEALRGEFLLEMNYKGSSSDASVEFSNLHGDYFENAGTYDDINRQAELSVGKSAYDGIWKFRSDIVLVYNQNTFILNEEIIADIQEAIDYGTIVVCEHSNTNINDIEYPDLCTLNDAPLPDSYYEY